MIEFITNAGVAIAVFGLLVLVGLATTPKTMVAANTAAQCKDPYRDPAPKPIEEKPKKEPKMSKPMTRSNKISVYVGVMTMAFIAITMTLGACWDKMSEALQATSVSSMFLLLIGVVIVGAAWDW